MNEAGSARRARAREVTLSALALSFLKIALASFGGGLSAWARQVIVEERRWLDEEEFLSALTLCRLLPGPNQVNMAIFVGGRFAGPAGVLAALAGLIVVPLALLLAMGVAYLHYHRLPALQSVLAGAVAAATGMALSMAVKIARPFSGRLDSLLFAAAAFVAVSVLRWPLVLVVAGLAPLALAWFWPRAKEGAP